MFVIANQKTIGVSREGGFASTRKTEEESDVILIFADVGRRMERKLAEFDGLKVVLEDTG